MMIEINTQKISPLISCVFLFYAHFITAVLDFHTVR